MNTYSLRIPIVADLLVEVEAESVEEALKKASDVDRPTIFLGRALFFVEGCRVTPVLDHDGTPLDLLDAGGAVLGGAE